MRSPENEGYAVAVGEQAAMQIKTGHAGHLQIGNQASGIGNVTTIEAVLGRGENLGVVSQMPNEIFSAAEQRGALLLQRLNLLGFLH
jgi:hypothetical protein